MKKYFQNLFDYEKTATIQVFETVFTLKEDTYPVKVDRIAAHLLAAQHIWLTRVRQEPFNGQVWPAELPRQEWLSLLTHQVNDWKAYLETVTDWECRISYQNSRGEGFENSLLEILQHLMLHGSYHRGQMMVLLRPLVETIPATDFIFHARKPQMS